MNRAQRYNAIYSPHKMRWAVSTGQGHPPEYFRAVKRHVKRSPHYFKEVMKPGGKLEQWHEDVFGARPFSGNKPLPGIGWDQLPNLPAKGVAVAVATNVIGLGMMIYGPMKFKLVGTALLAIPDVLIVPAVELIA